MGKRRNSLSQTANYQFVIMRGQYLLLIWALLWVVGCRQNAPSTIVTPTTADQPVAITATPIVLPTLYPTFTPPATLPPTPTSVDIPTEPQPTQIPLDTVVVTMRYAIPRLGLSRRLQGNAGTEITITDETTDFTTQRANQGTVLLEIQRALTNLILSELPEGCAGCVELEYSLPLLGQSGRGWLQDPILLSSIENYMASALGPHYPPQTLVGLRRSASVYTVAETVALTADGQLWRWLATEAEVAEAEEVTGTLPALLADVQNLTLPDRYLTTCPNVPIETLFLADENGGQYIAIICPELALPTNLIPFYRELDQALDEINRLTTLEHPELALPLNAILFYQRVDGRQLTLFADGQLQLQGASGEPQTDSLAPSEATNLLEALLATNLLTEDGSILLPAQDSPSFTFANVLAIRTELGVSGLGWDNQAPEMLQLLLESLDERLDVLQ